MKIATLSDGNEFRFNFVAKTTPWLGMILDSDTGTKIEVNRDSADTEEITFRTQGELVASYRTLPEHDPLLQIYAPSSDVYLPAFSEAIKEIYEEIPEIAVYLREGFSETPQELVELAPSPGDKVVMAVIIGVNVEEVTNL
ncbi:MAG: hypothetical protein ACYDBP_06695 [Leptospirales bacterium]